MSGHGLRSTYVAGCRCEDCTAANRLYARRRYVYGWDERVAADWVDPARAAEHVASLQAGGVGLRRISDQSGVARSTLMRLAVRGRISADTEARILAVSPAPARVDGTGTRRRLQALVSIGWSGTHLAGRMGWTTANWWSLVRDGRQVSDRTADLVADIYDQLWNRPGPSARARNLASREGWAPPLAWDDDTIDDPAAEPLDVTRRASRRTASEWLEDFQDTWDHHQGDLQLAAARLGVTRDALEQGLRRARQEVAS